MPRALRFAAAGFLVFLAPAVRAGQPTMSVEPKQIHFADQLILTESGFESVTITNAPGGSQLSLTSISLTNGDIGEFVLSCSGGGDECYTPGFLNPGESRTIQISFFPNQAGPREAILTITGNDTNNPSDEVVLTGVCIDPIFVNGFETLDPNWSDCVGGTCTPT